MKCCIKRSPENDRTSGLTSNTTCSSIFHIDEQRSTSAAKLRPIGCFCNFSPPSASQRDHEEWKWGIAFWNMPNHAERTASIHQSDNADKQQETDVSRDPWGSVTIYSRVQDIEFHTRKETINISWCDVLWCKTDCVLPLRNSSDFASYAADLTFRLKFSD